MSFKTPDVSQFIVVVTLTGDQIVSIYALPSVLTEDKERCIQNAAWGKEVLMTPCDAWRKQTKISAFLDKEKVYFHLYVDWKALLLN